MSEKDSGVWELQMENKQVAFTVKSPEQPKAKAKGVRGKGEVYKGAK